MVCPISYQLLEQDTPTGTLHPATTMDISSRGALIRTHEPLPLSSKYRLSIQIPGAPRTLIANGRVIRLEEEEPAQKYLIGFFFEKLEPPDSVEFLNRIESLDLRQMLETLVEINGSDLHLTHGRPPIARVKGRLTHMNRPPFRANEIRALLYSIMSEMQIELFERNREMDFAYSLALDKRFRFNVHWQRGQVEAAIRCIPSQITHWEKLGLPPVVPEWAQKPNGLILIVGPTGSGKTTTLSSLVELINRQRDAIIICLERPIEYVHQNDKAVIKQREIGSDTLSFAEAVRRAMRQDPDVITVGEIEDAETAQVVLTAAETGNLVLASFHATNSTQAIDRFINICPPQQRNQTCFRLASCLQGVLTQYLLPREEAMGGGTVLATEVFVPTDAGRNHIRRGDLTQLSTVIETGAMHRMHTLERSIRELLNQGLVSREVAEAYLALANQKI